ncbi:nuclear transport factor 2 family protein [Nocardioides gansuensis]|uniref:nuclear transport factor 2 family protein n=1 Tax=Nocardioides gansuensis TaxID=2138300 RepID=UPI0014036EE3|nr:nuclear transport factor 2 family protein [Nocardioides gansuensis]
MDAVWEVIERAEARATALANADAGQLGRLLHEDFRWTTHIGQTFNREEYIRRNTEGQTVWRSQELSGANVAIVADTAVLVGEVTDVVLRVGSPETFRMPITQVWVRQDDEWKCLAGHAGPRLT